jgi:hypothetical protein
LQNTQLILQDHSIFRILDQKMAVIKKAYVIPVAFIAFAAVASHFLPNFLKPKREDAILIPETQEWKK